MPGATVKVTDLMAVACTRNAEEFGRVMAHLRAGRMDLAQLRDRANAHIAARRWSEMAACFMAVDVMEMDGGQAWAAAVVDETLAALLRRT